MRHFKDPRFGPLYDALPNAIRELADKNFALLKIDPKHPSLHFKQVRGDLWYVRVGRKHGHSPSRATIGSNGSGSARMPTMIG